MNEEVENIMRLASLYATARCRRMTVNNPNYRGMESTKSVDDRIDKAKAELQAAVEALVVTDEAPTC